jgi:hypothetical protein
MKYELEHGNQTKQEVFKGDFTIKYDDSINRQLDISFCLWDETFCSTLLYQEPLPEYEDGMVITVATHQHPLKYVDYTGKSSNYGTGCFRCNVCSGSFSCSEKNFYCEACSYDLCVRCYKP